MLLEYTFEEMFHGMELLNEITQGHYKHLKYVGIDDEMRIMQIGDWKVFYTPTKHFEIRVNERLEKFPMFVQWKCMSTYFKNIQKFNQGYGRINGLLFLFGYKDIPLNQCVMIAYEIQYDSNEKVAEIVAKTIVSGIPTKGEEVSRKNINYDDIKIVSFDLAKTGNEISDKILMNDNTIVNGKTYRQRYKLKDLINQTAYIPCKVNWNNMQIISDADVKPGGIVTRFTKD